MQLDKTRIAVRERTLPEILDLGLLVLRRHAGPLAAAMSLGALPMMAVNQLLAGGMLQDVRFDEPWSGAQFAAAARYAWTLALLVFLEAPLASAFVTTYLGQMVFLERPKLRAVAAETLRAAPRLLWTQALLRAVLPAWLLVLTLRPDRFDPVLEGFFLPLCGLWAAAVRAFRPFMNELVLLERNPLRAARRGQMTIARRSAMLHGPSGADLLGRWIGSAQAVLLLAPAVFGLFVFLDGVLLNDWRLGPVLVQFWLPVSMWAGAAYMAVVRFLNYLDIRIRREGWEVELRLRAEAARLESSWKLGLEP